MATGWRYRITSVVGAGLLTAGAVAVANHPVVQTLPAGVPLYANLTPHTLANGQLEIAVLTTLVVVLGTLLPLFSPRPRRVLDTVVLSEQRVFVAIVALAAIGYFDYTYRLPRTTLILTGAILAVVVPVWFVGVRHRPSVSPRRAVIVGDDPEAMESILEAVEFPVVGYVSPPGPVRASGEAPRMADGGLETRTAETTGLATLDCLGGLSRLDGVLVEHDVDAALLAFSRPDREEFFGTLDTCHAHGVTAKVHRKHADYVLTTDVETADRLIDIDLEPWGWSDYVLKRTFDFAFAAVGLLAFAPAMAAIAVAIKLDDGGPVLYSQTRTAALGGTFTVHKFRTMVPDGESAAPVDDGANDRITRVGGLLRRTHLDELPQLWAILTGRMSVVGPRAAWTREESILDDRTTSWYRRWFVKPGLTGLAQINDVSSTEPERKLRYDVAYIRNQSLLFDLKIVIRQVWLVANDVASLVGERLRGR